MEDFIDEQCLHFEENFVNLDKFEASLLDNFDQLNERFLRKIQELEDENFLQSQMSTETVIAADTICKKCGHDILKL